MEHNEIINIWKSYDKKLEQNLLFNMKNAEDITKLKVQSFLASMKPLKIFTILVGILWVFFLDGLIINLINVASPFFLISVGIIALLNKLAIGIYLYQLILIYQTDINKPILETQNKLASLISTTLWVARILFLQLPLWNTFYLNTSIIKEGNVAFFLIQATIILLFVFVAIWLFSNIKYENRDKAWFRFIFNGVEWEPVMKSVELLNQVNDYKS